MEYYNNMTTTRYNILDKGYIDLLDTFGDELTIVNAARVSFGVEHEVLTHGDKKLLKYLYDHKHFSPFRHVFLRIRIHAPEAIMRQIAKHVIGIEATSNTVPVKDFAFNEISGRYKKVEEYYIPSEWRKQSQDNKQCSEGVFASDEQKELERVYNDALNLCISTYEKMMDMGVAKEQARMILPLSQYTTVLWTASLQAILNFISLRDHEHAQVEIRLYAQAMRDIVQTKFPTLCEFWL